MAGLLAITQTSDQPRNYLELSPSPSLQTIISQPDSPATVKEVPQPTNLFAEFIKPFVDEAVKKRAEWAKADPEYYHRVNEKLNKDRINIVVFGYGEEHGQTYEDYGGHMSILSLDLKNNKIGAVHLSRDTHLPELKGLLSADKNESLRNVFYAGRFPLMRRVVESATGLSADFQLVVKDTAIRDAIKQLTDGELEIEVKKEHDTQNFRLGGTDYVGGLIPTGTWIMDEIEVMRYMMAENKNPQEPTDERTLRKNDVLEALLKRIKNKIKADPFFLKQVLEFFSKQLDAKVIECDFDLRSLSKPFLRGLFNLALSKTTSLDKNLEISLPDTEGVTQININDPMFGGTAVSRTHTIEHNYQKLDRRDNQRLVEEIKQKLFPPWMLFPDGGDPYAPDLVKGYWFSVREVVKNGLSANEPNSTLKRSVSNETKALKKGLFREFAASKYQEVLKIREQRAKNDSEYLSRINPELNKDRINFLILGLGKEGLLTDSIVVLSYHLPSHSLSSISIPRDLQSPEVLKKTGIPGNSRINQALAVGGIDLAKVALENATSLSMDLNMVVNFDVLVDLIDKTVGYVEVELNKPINDPEYPALTGFGFDPFFIEDGKHQLDGQTALKVARSRHGSTDYERSERQRMIIMAYVKRLLDEPIKIIPKLFTVDRLVNQKIKEGGLKVDFDPTILSFSNLIQGGQSLSSLFWERGPGITEQPTFFSTGITNKNLIVGARVPGASINKIRGGNPYSDHPRRDYWGTTREFTQKFLTENVGQPPLEEEVKIIPSREERVFHPQELTYSEVKKWIGKLRDSHDSVLTESLFTKEIAGFTKEKRQEILQAIAQAHARGLVEHYGDVEAIIGLDPGHGGSDVGASGTAPGGKVLAEKELTWELSQMIASQIYQQTNGKYRVVFLRPENPQDEDLDGDGVISPIERLQKRKALLLEMEKKLRLNPQDWGKNIVYLSVHFNGSPGYGDPNIKGVEIYWPNETAVTNQEYRDSSQQLAKRLHQAILKAIRQTGYKVVDRGAKEDPDRRTPRANSEMQTGPYIALGSPKLDRSLARF